jgi:hypothetical protein
MRLLCGPKGSPTEDELKLTTLGRITATVPESGWEKPWLVSSIRHENAAMNFLMPKMEKNHATGY